MLKRLQEALANEAAAAKVTIAEVARAEEKAARVAAAQQAQQAKTDRAAANVAGVEALRDLSFLNLATKLPTKSEILAAIGSLKEKLSGHPQATGAQAIKSHSNQMDIASAYNDLVLQWTSIAG